MIAPFFSFFTPVRTSPVRSPKISEILGSKNTVFIPKISEIFIRSPKTSFLFPKFGKFYPQKRSFYSQNLRNFGTGSTGSTGLTGSTVLNNRFGRSIIHVGPKILPILVFKTNFFWNRLTGFIIRKKNNLEIVNCTMNR